MIQHRQWEKYKVEISFLYIYEMNEEWRVGVFLRQVYLKTKFFNFDTKIRLTAGSSVTQVILDKIHLVCAMDLNWSNMGHIAF